MTIKDAEVEDLGIAALALGRFSFRLVRRSAAATYTNGLPLRESGHLDGTGLVRIFIVRPTPSAHARAEVVLGTFDRDADDGGVAARRSVLWDARGASA